MPKLRQLFSQLKVFIGKRKEQAHKAKLLRHQQNLNKKLFKQLRPRKIPSWNQVRNMNRVLSPMERNIMRLNIVAIIGACAFLLYANFIRSTVSVPALGGIYSEGEIGAPATLNPILAPSNAADQDITRLIYNGLVRYDANYQIVPDLAESWTVSEDFKTITMKLRSNVEWHDRSPFTANDVLATIAAIQTPDMKSPLLRTFSGVKIEKADENTLIFSLPASLPRFIKNLTVGILPAKILEGATPEQMNFSKSSQNPIGTGPYKITAVTKDKAGKISAINLTANSDYHLDSAKIETFNLNYYPDYQTAVEALKNKMIDGLGYIPKEYLTQVSKHDLKITTLDLTQFTAVFFNQESDTLLKRAVIRKALTLATNKAVLVEDVLRNQGYPLHTPILPGFPGFDPAVVDAFDPAQAQQILRDDGWELNPEGILEKKKTPLEIKLTILDLPDMQKLGALLKDQWQQIGVRVILEPVNPANLAKDILQERNYEALAIGELFSPDGDLFPFWHSSQKTYPGLNLSQYVNRTADEAMEGLRTIDTAEEKEKLAAKIQSTILSDTPALFLYAPTYSYPINISIKTVPMARLSLPSDRFWNITDWYIQTKKAWK